MTAPTLIAQLHGMPLSVVGWPIIFGIGALLLLVAQPIGRPKPDLVERLRRLNVEQRFQEELQRPASQRFPASPLLDAFIGPLLADVGRLVRTTLGQIGVARTADFERSLALERPGVQPTQFIGEKVATGLIGLALFPLMNAFELHPFGVWPVWVWLIGLIAGFHIPDWDLRRRVAHRRTRVIVELPAILDLLTITASAGLALEQSLHVVAQQTHGLVADELRHVVREMAFGHSSVMDALEGVAQRTAQPELTTLVGQLRTAHEQGLPLVQTLSTQADAIREQKRLSIIEEGGKASVRMVLPVALFILPVLFVVLLVPAAVELMHLGG
jgi:tight adherence protein C